MGGRRSRWLTGATVLALGVVAATVVVGDGVAAPAGAVDESAGFVELDDVGATRSLLREDFGGDVILGPGDVPLLTTAECPAQRLPAAVDPLWEVDLAGARRIVSPVSLGAESVVAIVGSDEVAPNGLASLSLVALDLGDGMERWRTDLQPSTGAHEIVGITDRVVVVSSAAGPDMAYRRLFAFDEVTGAVLWDRGFRGEWSAMIDAESGRVYVRVRRPTVSTSVESEVVILDVRNGRREHVAAGAFVGLDPDGRLVTRVGDEVLATSPSDRDLLGVVVPGDAPYTVAGPRVVFANGDTSELSIVEGGTDVRRFPLVGSTGIDAPNSVAYVEALGESALLVGGEGAVRGAKVGEGTVEIRWRVAGAMLGSAVTDRGRSLLIATEGGAQQRVVDSSTGRTIVNVQLRPGALTTLALVANGLVMLDVVDGITARAAFDLDGRMLWAFPGTGPLAVGEGVVVDVVDADGVVQVAAFADALEAGDETSGCRSVMTEWIPR